jgi:hypothetical protein
MRPAAQLLRIHPFSLSLLLFTACENGAKDEEQGGTISEDTHEQGAADGGAEGGEGTAEAPALAVLVQITPAGPFNDARLGCTATAADPGSGALTSSLRWTNLSAGVELGNAPELLLDADLAAPGDRILCAVTATDTHRQTAEASAEVEIAGRPPTLTVRLSPLAPTLESTLSCEAEADDLDGDLEVLNLQWRVDGMEVPASGLGGDGSSVLDAGLSRGDLVECTATAVDSLGLTASATAAFGAENRPPNTPTVTVSPTSPDPADALRCALTTPAADPDGDPVSLSYAWTVDGAAYIGAVTDGAASLIPAGVVGPRESWTCTATVSDSEEAVNSAPVTVRSSARGCSAVDVSGGDILTGTPTSALTLTVATGTTVELWIAPDVGSEGMLIGARSGALPGWSVRYEDATAFLEVSTTGGSGSSGYLLVRTDPMTEGAWHHLAFVRSPGSASWTAYVDGVEATDERSGPGGGADYAPVGDLIVGAWPDGGSAHNFSGLIGPIGLSASARYTGTFTPPLEPLGDSAAQGRWLLDEAAGSTAADSAGTVDLSLAGPSWVTAGPRCP